MKSIICLIVLSVSLLCNNASLAQESKSTGSETVSTSDKENKDYAEKLNLDKEQAVKFEAINKKYEEEVKAVKIKSKTKKTTKKLKALEKQRDKALKALLSEEQFQKYIEMRRQERGRLKTLIRKSNRQ